MMRRILLGITTFILNILSCNKPAVCNPDVLDRFQAESFEHNETSPGILLYRLFLPEYSGNKRYPLVLILHSGGERGSDNKKQLTLPSQIFSSEKNQKQHPCFIVVPQCPPGTQWLNTTFKSIPFNNYYQDEIPESREMKLIMALLRNMIERYPVDSTRIYVTGYSMGGSGTWDIITRYPHFFAAAAPVTGVSDISKTKLIVHLPIWAFHGRFDTVTPVEVTRRTIATLHLHGSAVSRLTEYSLSGHVCWNKVYTDKKFLCWLFEQTNTQ